MTDAEFADQQAMTGKTKCDRCQGPIPSHSISTFNSDVLCSGCLADEKLAPGYAAAKAWSDEDLQNLIHHRPRVPAPGLSIKDMVFLAERILQRQLKRQQQEQAVKEIAL